MGGMGDFTRGVGDGIAGLLGGAVGALVDAFWTVVDQLHAWLPGPLLPIVVGVTFLALLLWTFRK